MRKPAKPGHVGRHRGHAVPQGPLPGQHASSGQLRTGLHPRPPSTDAGCDYVSDFVSAPQRSALDRWLATLHPLWEQRYSTQRPVPEGKQQHRLLRPVYWLGNWQFACLGYYEPPRRTQNCAVAAEPFPEILQQLVATMERRIRSQFPASFVPAGWQLNTCLVNFYGSRLDGAKWVDVARVGEHRDFEPGPVASISLGERALFQFIRRGNGSAPPVRSQWLEDNSLQLFGGPVWKDDLLHRVTRVENKRHATIGPSIEAFATRRINLTFRYVPVADVTPVQALSRRAQLDIAPYLATLAEHSAFFARQHRVVIT
ncbi:MAG: alpha-ketoglutarate-dependent dioxygenase AlkB [Kofleriaceae bacterium]|nr:alpha-ketoglutarate-dependent dioxygenase AlkB [Kofleriaceae bacterium]